MYATIEGRRINYIYPPEAEAGVKKGKTVLLIHGATDNHKIWARQIQHLSQEHTPIALDLPGRGESEGPPIQGISEFREFIRAFAEVMNLAPFVICGHSMGGTISLDYAIHYPDKLRGVILVGGGAKWEVSDADIESLRQDLPNALKDMAEAMFAKQTPSHIIEGALKEISSTSVEAVVADMIACKDVNLVDQLHEIKLPILLIAGEEEPYIEESRLIKSRIPQAQMEMIPGAAHEVPIEQPERLNRVISEFLRSLN